MIIFIITKKNMSKVKYFKKTTNQILTNRWGFPVRLNGVLYIECDSVGKVDWDNATVLDEKQLKKIKNTKIHD